MHKTLVAVSMLALFGLTACGQTEKEASCENVVDNIISLMAKDAKTDQKKAEVEAFKDQKEKADAIKDCRAARPSAEALRCAANAKTMDEFVGCGLPMMK